MHAININMFCFVKDLLLEWIPVNYLMKYMQMGNKNNAGVCINGEYIQ